VVRVRTRLRLPAHRCDRAASLADSPPSLRYGGRGRFIAEQFGWGLQQSKSPEAEQVLKRALAVLEKALGPDHPNVAIAVNNLAGLYKDQGRHEEAEIGSRAWGVD